ncbi:hypothetical protein BT93_D0153 [Corymbia citriodora subsp. variegata]|nr:hypothetical protein BT93_D0153 [Corymbia citriodora subsp. variegata]
MKPFLVVFLLNYMGACEAKTRKHATFQVTPTGLIDGRDCDEPLKKMDQGLVRALASGLKSLNFHRLLSVGSDGPNWSKIIACACPDSLKVN